MDIIFIMPFLCVTIDVKPYIVFENVKIENSVNTLWIGALYYCKKHLIFSTVQKFFKTDRKSVV